MTDPTRMRNQPSLTTSTGRSWLILGGLLGAISAGLLIALLPREPAGVAAAGLTAVLVLYGSMIVVRVTTAPGRLRLGLLATLMIAIAVVALASVLIIAAAESNT